MKFFDGILLKVILEDAITREESAYRFYEAALDHELEPDADLVIRRLMAGELTHRLKLEELQRRESTLTGTPGGELPVEIQEFSGYQLIIPSGASARDIFKVALQKEQQAAGYYHRLCESSGLTKAKELFMWLSLEESRHVTWVRDHIDTGMQ